MSSPETDMDAFTDDGMASASRKRRVAVTIGVVLALIVALWFLFLRGNGDAPTEASVFSSTDAGVEQAAQPTKKEAKAARSRVETFEVFAPKDPFEPLIEPAAPRAAGEETTPVVTEPSTSGAGEFGETTTFETTGSSAGSGSNQRSDTVGGHRVKVIDVFRENGKNRAQVEVDGTVYTVDEGERFAQNFQLVSASGQCATMLFGDDEFTLCEGEEILK